MPSGIYNLSDRNLQVLDLRDTLKSMYPSMEFIYINQHLELRELKIKTNGLLTQYVDIPETTLEEELVSFSKQFSY